METYYLLCVRDKSKNYLATKKKKKKNVFPSSLIVIYKFVTFDQSRIKIRRRSLADE